jgi:hypothetical protein
MGAVTQMALDGKDVTQNTTMSVTQAQRLSADHSERTPAELCYLLPTSWIECVAIVAAANPTPCFFRSISGLT